MVRLLLRPAAALSKTLLIAAGVLALASLVLLVAGYRIATWPQRRGHRSDRETMLAFLTAAAALVALLRQRQVDRVGV